MVNYNDALIYKIVSKDLNLNFIYVGSTCNFKSRKNKHKSACCNEKDKVRYNFKVYKTIRENGGWDGFEMILIKYFPCDTKLELLQEERKIKEELNDNLGSMNPIRYKEDVKKYYERRMEKYECVLCGKKVHLREKARHNRTKKHLKLLEIENKNINNRLND
tara:strand:- start:64 stop:549 length:486 start_codon:yes stop_codon:yes gene_type:complete